MWGGDEKYTGKNLLPVAQAINKFVGQKGFDFLFFFFLRLL